MEDKYENKLREMKRRHEEEVEEMEEEFEREMKEAKKKTTKEIERITEDFEDRLTAVGGGGVG